MLFRYMETHLQLIVTPIYLPTITTQISMVIISLSSEPMDLFLDRWWLILKCTILLGGIALHPTNHFLHILGMALHMDTLHSQVKCQVIIILIRL